MFPANSNGSERDTLLLRRFVKMDYLGILFRAFLFFVTFGAVVERFCHRAVIPFVHDDTLDFFGVFTASVAFHALKVSK